MTISTHSLITFIDPNGRIYNLPVTPEEIRVNDGTRIIRSSVLSVGEITQLGERKAKSISFSSFFPEYNDTYVNSIATTVDLFSLPDPEEDLGLLDIEERINALTNIEVPGRLLHNSSQWIDIIQELRRNPVSVIITFPYVQQKFLISDFTYAAVGGSGREIEYTIDLVAFRDISIRTLESPIVGPRGTDFLDDPLVFNLSNFYTIVPGDTLVSISIKTGVDGTTLKSLNDIKDSSVQLLAGDVIDLGVPRLI